MNSDGGDHEEVLHNNGEPATENGMLALDTGMPMLHLAGILPLTNFVARLPLPTSTAEGGGGQTLINHPQTQMLATQYLNSDGALALPIATSLARSDTSGIVLKDEYARTACKMNLEVGGALDPALIQAILRHQPTVFLEALNQDAKPFVQQNEYNNPPQADVQVATTSADTTGACAGAEATMSHANGHTPDTPGTSSSPPPTPKTQGQAGSQELRQKIVSVGKQPKAHSKKKRDMVSGLFDSLTPDAAYFDPEQKRRRGRGGRDQEHLTQTSDNQPSARPVKRKHSQQSGEGDGSSSDQSGDDNARPLTPDAELREKMQSQRDYERERREKLKRHRLTYNLDVDEQVILDTVDRFTQHIDNVFDNCELTDLAAGEEEDEIPSECLIEKSVLSGLCEEAYKLKSFNQMHRVPKDKLTKLLTILEKNVRDGTNFEQLQSLLFDEKDEDEFDDTYRELVDDRVLRSCDAAVTALTIMTCSNMPKEVIIEDAIERCVQLCKLLNANLVFPAFDLTFRGAAAKEKKNKEHVKRKSKSAQQAKQRHERTYKEVLRKMSDVLLCLSELLAARNLSEVAVVQLCSLCVDPFFVDSAEMDGMKHCALRLAVVLFAKHEKFRNTVLADILSQMHKLAVGKRLVRSYQCGLKESTCIQMVTALVLHLLQSVVQKPLDALKQVVFNDSFDTQQAQEDPDDDADDMHLQFVDLYDTAASLAQKFLTKFLEKCRKSDENYRSIFENFLEDLLMAVHKMQLPAAELCLSVLGQVLVLSYRNNKLDMTLRSTCLLNLGTIAASLRAAGVSSKDDSRTLLEILDSLEPEQNGQRRSEDTTIDDDVRNGLLQTALIHNVHVLQHEDDPLLQHSIQFYLGQWHKDSNSKYERERDQVDSATATGSARDVSARAAAGHKQHEQMLQCYNHAKFNLQSLFVTLKQQTELMANPASAPERTLSDRQLVFVVRYLAHGRAFSLSFESHLRNILNTALNETSQRLRMDAMKCLTKVLEADCNVLMMKSVKQAVTARLMDNSPQVREATIDLIGRYISKRPDLISEYYDTLSNRIKDAALSVRKRVIRIMREVAETRPSYEKLPEIMARIVRRINDEETVKKLVIDNCLKIWFEPNRDKQNTMNTVNSLVDTVAICVRGSAEQKKEQREHGKEKDVIGTLESFETLLHSILAKPRDKDGKEKEVDRSVLQAATQIVDSLVDLVVSLDAGKYEQRVAVHESTSAEQKAHAHTQLTASIERLQACLACLFVFSKTRPELLVQHVITLAPYIRTEASVSEQHYNSLVQVMRIMERVVPLIEHPDKQSLAELEVDLRHQVASARNVGAIQTAVAAWAAIVIKQKMDTKHAENMMLQQEWTVYKAFQRARAHSQFLPSERPTMLRGITTQSLLMRYFDFSHVPCKFVNEEFKEKANTSGEGAVEGDTEPEDNEQKVKNNKDFFYRCVLELMVYDEQNFRKTSLVAMGHFCAAHGEYLMRGELSRNYKVLLIEGKLGKGHLTAEEAISLKMQVLRNLQMFLEAEEQQCIDAYDQWQNTKEQEMLQEMGDEKSGLSSSVIQCYWNAVLQAYFSGEPHVRDSCHRVIALTLSQGLVTPGTSIPTLVAMSTDPVAFIRNKAELLLKEIDGKYANMIAGKAVSGVFEAHRLHELINTAKYSQSTQANRPSVRGFMDLAQGTSRPAGSRVLANDTQARLAPLYQLLRTAKTTRRNLITNLLKQFDKAHRHDTSAARHMHLSQLVFIADNLATLPYQLLDEPLFVIYQIDQIICTSGANWCGAFRDHLMPRAVQTTHKHAQHTQQHDDDETPKDVYVRLPADVNPLYDLMEESKPLFLLLIIKDFLHRYYKEVDQTKINEYTSNDNRHDKVRVSRQVHYPAFDPLSLLAKLVSFADEHEQEKRRSIDQLWNLSVNFIKFRDMMLQYDDEEDEILAQTETEGDTQGQGQSGDEQMDDDDE